MRLKTNEFSETNYFFIIKLIFDCSTFYTVNTKLKHNILDLISIYLVLNLT
jgi:hypothetical protein